MKRCEYCDAAENGKCHLDREYGTAETCSGYLPNRSDIAAAQARTLERVVELLERIADTLDYGVDR